MGMLTGLDILTGRWKRRVSVSNDATNQTECGPGMLAYIYQTSRFERKGGTKGEAHRPHYRMASDPAPLAQEYQKLPRFST